VSYKLSYILLIILSNLIYRYVIGYAKYLNPNIKMIASTGTDYKVDLLKSMGVDVAVNYKKEDLNHVLKDHGPIDM